MLERFTYTNSLGEVLEFGKDCLFVNENDLRDFAWNITSKNDKISSFKKGIVQKTIPIILKCASEDEGLYLRNKLFEVFEKDVLTRKYGKIHIGDYYLRCYITGTKKTEYLVNKNYMVISATVRTDVPEWIKETTTAFNVSNNKKTRNIERHLDYPYDFPHDYKNSLASYQVTNSGLVASNFILTIFGYVQQPTLYINGHEYTVNVVVDDNEYLTIDSINKTIILTKANGEQVNCFNKRNKDSYIFEKIPVGTNVITSQSQRFRFNVTLLEERSEPKWI